MQTPQFEALFQEAERAAALPSVVVLPPIHAPAALAHPLVDLFPASTMPVDASASISGVSSSGFHRNGLTYS